jgi:hypothetical protein
MTSPEVHGVESSRFADFTWTKITTLITAAGSSTLAVTVVRNGIQLPQNILGSDTVTDSKPGPGLIGVGGVAGVAVSLPIKIGIGTKVFVGKLGSCVGIWTTVADGVIVGVIVSVGVTDGVAEAISVAVGPEVAVVKGVDRRNGMLEHDCKNNVSSTAGNSLCISYLFHAIMF